MTVPLGCLTMHHEQSEPAPTSPPSCRHRREALDYLRHGDRPDLILRDMDGRQFRRQQRRDPALAPIPVVVVSGTKDAARSAADLGAVACLEKPVGFDEPVEAVRQHC